MFETHICTYMFAGENIEKYAYDIYKYAQGIPTILLISTTLELKPIKVHVFNSKKN